MFRKSLLWRDLANNLAKIGDIMKPVKRPVKGGSQKGKWEVDFGIDAAGKRWRPSFQTEAAADTAIEKWNREQKQHGEFWARLKPVERQSVVAVLTEVKAAKMTLTQVWEDHKRWRRDSAQTCVTPKTYAEAVEGWEERKRGAGKDERYIEEGAALLMRFGQGREKMNLHEISYGDLKEWVDKQERWKSINTKRINISIFSSLWEAGKAEGWCSMNICDRFEEMQKPEPDVRIYPNELVLRLMAGALHNPATYPIVAELALGLFGCMRPEEVQSIKALRNGLSDEKLFGWHRIDLKYRRIDVRREIAKLRDVRVIRMHDTCWEWLAYAKKLGCQFPTENERKLTDEVCELIGLTDWIRDGLRKNCATHLRIVYKNDYEVTLDMGNSVRILLQHYAKLHVPPEQSKEYWAITPDRVQKYMKTEAWKQLLIRVAEDRAKQLASEIAKFESSE